MEKNGWDKKKYLIDGFPRNQDNYDGWNKVMGEITDVPCIFYFKASLEEMTERILKRAETSGRSDDNRESLQKRFITFQNDSKPIIDLFSGKGMCREIDAMKSVDDVYVDFKKGFGEFL